MASGIKSIKVVGYEPNKSILVLTHSEANLALSTNSPVYTPQIIDYIILVIKWLCGQYLFFSRKDGSVTMHKSNSESHEITALLFSSA